MEWSALLQRALRGAVVAAAASFALAACGAGTSVGSPGFSHGNGASGTGGGTGAGSGSGGTGSGSGGASGSGTGTGSGSGSGGSGSGSGSGGSGTGGGSGTATAPPVSTLVVGPQSIDASLGSAAQVAVLDPNYSGPIAVNVNGSAIENAVVSSALALQSGVLQGTSGTSDVLDVDLAKLLSLGVLGSDGTILRICETAMTPPVCQNVALTPNPTASEITSNLSSAVLIPGAVQLLQLQGQSGLTGFTNFHVTVSDNNIAVTGLGNGQFDLSAIASVGAPTTATVTATDGMGHTLTIPVMVL